VCLGSGLGRVARRVDAEQRVEITRW